MKILLTTILLTVGMMFATACFAGNEGETATETVDVVAEEAPPVQAAPPDETVAVPGPIEGTDAADDEEE